MPIIIPDTPVQPTAAAAAPFSREDLVLLYTIVTARVAIMALHSDLPEDRYYRQRLQTLADRIDQQVRSHG